MLAVLVSCDVPFKELWDGGDDAILETDSSDDGGGTTQVPVTSDDGTTQAPDTSDDDDDEPQAPGKDPENDPVGDDEDDTTEGDNEQDPPASGGDDEGGTSSQINYGTQDAPVSTTYANDACADLENGESSASPFYVKGEVTEIGEDKGNYYKNVYFTDGTTEMLIYTINMASGVSGFEVGDTIVAYGYIKNYSGTIEMATYNGTVYVYVVSVEPADDGQGGGNQGGGSSSSHTYTDFTASEKSLFTNAVGLVIPFIPNDDYTVEEILYDGVNYISFYTFGNTQAEFDAYRALFSDYSYDGSEEDEYGDTWYYYTKGDVYVDLAFYNYEGDTVVDVCVYLADDDDTGNNGNESQIDYGTLDAPVSTTYANNACADLENGESSASPFYVKGKVTEIGEDKGNYYKNVYFTDGTTEMLIYTINMASGVSGFEVGDTIVAYGYIKNYSGTIEMATYNGTVYVYVVSVEPADDGQGGGNQGDGSSSSHTYTDFTSSEKSLFTNAVGLVIPFIPNDDYTVEEILYDGVNYINFYTFGNTQAEFDAYRALFSDYSYDGSEEDEYGDTWYYYTKGDVYVDMSFYYYEGDYVVDIYVCLADDDGGDSGSQGGGSTESEDLLTNDGKGLPTDSDGVYDVDFTDGSYVKDVTDQGYYLDGCPTTGSPAVLVIPVEFSDATAQSKGYTIENIEKIFNGEAGSLSYYSLYEYFLTSSYGKLDLDITVVDNWFRPKNSSSYYENRTMTMEGYEIAIGDQLIMDEALAYLATIMDLSQFDSDNNGVIDAVVMVNTLDIGDDDFHWAYRYWNFYTDSDGYYYEYDGVSANDYVWVPYEFMFEYCDENGDVDYSTSNPLNPYTFIHEFSHILGADDYYDTSYTGSPMGGYDVMDSMAGDHNPYTKFNYGWITSSRLVVTDSSVTLTLDAFAKNGDTILLANNWDDALGAYQEYYVIMYYTATGLNAGEGGYFTRDGILVYHVNSSLFADDSYDEIYYDVYNNNTSPSGENGTKDNLVEYVLTGAGYYTFGVGDSLPVVTDDAGNALGYTFTVDELTAESATITFTKK